MLQNLAVQLGCVSELSCCCSKGHASTTGACTRPHPAAAAAGEPAKPMAAPAVPAVAPAPASPEAAVSPVSGDQPGRPEAAGAPAPDPQQPTNVWEVASWQTTARHRRSHPLAGNPADPAKRRGRRPGAAAVAAGAARAAVAGGAGPPAGDHTRRCVTGRRRRGRDEQRLHHRHLVGGRRLAAGSAAAGVVGCGRWGLLRVCASGAHAAERADAPPAPAAGPERHLGAGASWSSSRACKDGRRRRRTSSSSSRGGDSGGGGGGVQRQRGPPSPSSCRCRRACMSGSRSSLATLPESATACHHHRCPAQVPYAFPGPSSVPNCAFCSHTKQSCSMSLQTEWVLL